MALDGVLEFLSRSTNSRGHRRISKRASSFAKMGSRDIVQVGTWLKTASASADRRDGVPHEDSQRCPRWPTLRPTARRFTKNGASAIDRHLQRVAAQGYIDYAMHSSTSMAPSSRFTS